MKLYKRKPDDRAPLGQPDPYMIKASDGRYYIYATGPAGPQLYSSDHLTDGWEYEGVCLDMTGQKNCWAPCVLEIDGTYYMYYSSMDADSDDEHGQTMRVAISDSPHGPFRKVKDLLPPFSIDPHTVATPSGLYFFYCQNVYEAERVGTVIVCDKMKDPLTVEGKPVCVVRPTMDEEIYQRDRFRKGEHWHTIEGAFYFCVGETHFLMYSGACHQNPTYFIGYSVAHGAPDADLRTLDWKKYPDDHTYAPLISKTDTIEGMGHNSVLLDGRKYYIVYHGRDITDSQPAEDSRCARIDELKIDGDKLSVQVTE